MGIVRARLDENTHDFKEESGVYFLYRGSEVIYIGESNNIKRRLTEHLGTRALVTSGKPLEEIIRETMATQPHHSKISKNSDFSEFLLSTNIGRLVDYVEVIYTQDRVSLERRYISKYRPIFNKQHNTEFHNQTEKRNILRATSSVVGVEYWEESELGYYWQVLETVRTLRDFRPQAETKEVA